jgi:hypothetical protein
VLRRAQLLIQRHAVGRVRRRGRDQGAHQRGVG